MTVSVIISARNEFPSVVHTLHSIINDLETFLNADEFEIIIVDNLSNDENDVGRSTGGTVDFLRTRAAYANGVVKILYDPLAGNVSARNKGAQIAQGDYLFFSDAHMSYRYGSFERMILTIDECGGVVHPAIAWMGTYPPETVYQYSWNLGEQFDGTWNDSKVSDEWFYVPAMGHCCLGLRREQFLGYRGYPDNLRCYGGGGMFLDTKWWMLGSSVVTEPRVTAYHLSATRGYSYGSDDYIHNVFHAALILGADAWAERVYLCQVRNGRKETLAKLWEDAEREAQDQRLFMSQHSRMSFNDLIIRRPWDMLNYERVGKQGSGLTIAPDTLSEIIKGTPAEAIFPGQHQSQLEELIKSNLAAFCVQGIRESRRCSDK